MTDFNLSAQNIKWNGLNSDIFLSSGITKTGYELSNRAGYRSIYPDIIIPLLNDLNIINSLKQRGLNIKGIDYKISVIEDNVVSPDLGSISYAKIETDLITSSLLTGSSIKKNSLGINELLFPLVNEFSDYISDFEVPIEPIIKSMVSELFSSQFSKLCSNQCFIEPVSEYSIISEGYISCGLDKLIVCEETCVDAVNHQKFLSEFNLTRPWAQKMTHCSYCSSNVIESSGFLCFNVDDIFSKYNVNFPNRELSQALVTINNIGANLTKIINLTLKKEFNISNNLSDIMVYPEIVYFESEGLSQRVVLSDITGTNYKRFLGRNQRKRVKFELQKKTL